jgi:dTDP-4-amino-4,6-dideoxygalactose transaminase
VTVCPRDSTQARSVSKRAGSRGEAAVEYDLTANGVGTEIYYPLPLHAQRCFAYLEHEPADFPEAQRAAEEVLALPIYPELTVEQREYVVEQIASFVRSARR